MKHSAEPLLAYLDRPNRKRLEKVVHSYHAFVWRVAYRVTGHREDATDICQDVFLKLLLDPPAAGSVRAPLGYLSWRVLHRVNQLRRSADRRRKRERESFQHANRDGLLPEDYDALYKEIERLPADLRTTVELRYLAGLSGRDVGRILAISESAVSQRLDRARGLLKRRLTEFAPSLAILSVQLPGTDTPPEPAALLPQLVKLCEKGAAVSATSASGAAAAAGAGASTFLVGAKKVAIPMTAAALLTGAMVFLADRFTSESDPNADSEVVGSAQTVDDSTAGDVTVANVSLSTEAAALTDEAEDSADAGPVALRGRVTNARGEPVAGAKVFVLESERFEALYESLQNGVEDDVVGNIRSFSDRAHALLRALSPALTDEDGSYAFSALAPGTSRVFASHPSYLGYKKGWVLIQGGEESLFDITLSDAYSIAGRVVTTGGAALSGASVLALSADAAKVRGIGQMMQMIMGALDGSAIVGNAPVTTAADGSFRFESLAPVLHSIKVRHDDYALTQVDGIPVGEDGIVVVMSSGPSLVGQLVGPNGEAVSGATVTVAAPTLDPSRATQAMMLGGDLDLLREKTRSTKTAGDGSFSLRGVAAGALSLTARTEGLPPHSQVVVIPAEGLDVGTIELEEPFQVGGVVRTAGGVELSGARVWLTKAKTPRSAGSPKSAADVLAEVVTGDSGAFSFAGVAAGEYRVHAMDDQNGAAVAESVMAGEEALELRIASAAVVRGVCLDAIDHSPITGAAVRLRNVSERVRQSGDDGGFEFLGVLPDADSLSLSIQHREYQRKQLQLQLDAAGPQEFLLEPKQGVSGVVLNASGERVAGARVAVEVPGLPPAMMAITGGRLADSTDAEGGFFVEMTPNPALTPEIAASHPDWGKARVGPFQPDELPSEVEIVLQETTAVEGKVTTVDGSPVDRARVLLKRDVEINELIRMQIQLLPPGFADTVAYTSADGTFRIGGLERGTYSAEVQAVGFAKSLIEQIDLTAEEAHLDVQLDLGQVIEVRVVDGDGGGLSGVEVVALVQMDVGDSPLLDEQNRYEMEVFRATNSSGTAAAVSGPDGHCVLTRLPDATYTIVARAEGYGFAQVNDIRPGDACPDIVLARHGLIEGYVTDAASGEAVTSFQVRLVRRSDDRTTTLRILEQQTLAVDHDDGLFECANLLPAKYDLKVWSAAHAVAVHTFEIESGEERSVDVSLVPGGTVRGTVHSQGGAPLSGVRVTLIVGLRAGDGKTLHDIREATTSDDGTFEVHGLTAGTATVTPSHSDFCLHGSVPNVEVSSDSPATVDMVLEAAGRLQGEVRRVDLGSDARPGYEVRLISDPQHGDRRTRTTHLVTSDGRFEFASIRPGDYEVQLWAEGETKSSKRVSIRAHETTRVEL